MNYLELCSHHYNYLLIGWLVGERKWNELCIYWENRTGFSGIDLAPYAMQPHTRFLRMYKTYVVQTVALLM